MVSYRNHGVYSNLLLSWNGSLEDSSFRFRSRCDVSSAYSQVLSNRTLAPSSPYPPLHDPLNGLETRSRSYWSLLPRHRHQICCKFLAFSYKFLVVFCRFLVFSYRFLAFSYRSLGITRILLKRSADQFISFHMVISQRDGRTCALKHLTCELRRTQ